MENESLHATLKLEKQCVKTFFSCLSSVEVPIEVESLVEFFDFGECKAISAWYPLASATVGKAPRVSA